MEVRHAHVTRQGTLLHLYLATDDGWVLSVVDPARLALLITSDYGSWGHRWSNVGDDFDLFLFQREAFHTIACKLWLDKGDRRVWDAKATKSAILQEIAQVAREQLRRDRDQIYARFCPRQYRYTAARVLDADTFEELCEDREIASYIDVTYEDHHRTRLCSEFVRLQNEILPALAEAWKAYV